MIFLVRMTLAAHPSQHEEPAQPSTILLVEDDTNDAFTFRRAFDRSGHREALVHLQDGEEAIEYLRTTAAEEVKPPHSKPLLVFLDLKMPKIDGLEVLTWLRSHVEFSGVPVVVLSGSIRKEDQQAAVDLGAKAFHTKPMDSTELNAILRS